MLGPNGTILLIFWSNNIQKHVMIGSMILSLLSSSQKSIAYWRFHEKIIPFGKREIKLFYYEILGDLRKIWNTKNFLLCLIRFNFYFSSFF